MFADLAQKKIEEATFGGSFGAKLGLRWGKGADLVPKKLENGIFRQSCDGRAARVHTWKPTLGPSWRQEGVKRAKLGSEIEVSGSRCSMGAAVVWACWLRIRNFRKQI